MRKLNKRKIAWVIREMQKREISVGQIAKQQGITTRWVRELKRRYDKLGYIQAPCKPGPTPRPITKAEIALIQWFKQHYAGGAVNLEKIMRSYEIEFSHNRIHKVLKQTNLAKNEPKKQKKRKWVRYERKHSNSLWHTDWFEYNRMQIIAYLDDASRLVTAVGVFDDATAENAVLVLNQAVQEYGTPKQVISDHGTQFTANIFKERLEQLGIEHIKARVKHPQTNGKMERWFQTLKHLVEHFKEQDYALWFYNHKRPHMSLEKADGTIVTPIQAFQNKKLKRGEKHEEKNKNGT